jgi:hypothetical protein
MAGDKTCERRGSASVFGRSLRKIGIGTPVLVNWLDIVTEANWVSKDKFIEQEPVECITVGIWMEPGPNCIHIASNINGESCDGTTIPMGCVLRVKVIGDSED